MPCSQGCLETDNNQDKGCRGISKRKEGAQAMVKAETVGTQRGSLPDKGGNRMKT